ncbi:alpha/beta fold hydrolase [Scleromatobacter humisilvae]|uniref:Alpha/beta fold hydrolase n=1 Tax=Scleromatobacter humisilvae TaxID=2897159 RepID=A0A9X2C1Y7_9BURK|nr:alpha/beta fold hydrolase [Scleromatobacter humisilvae]MCK9688096.1 alpha/beta fold hydrolase [Scleromatobacter humisilvae]
MPPRSASRRSRSDVVIDVDMPEVKPPADSVSAGISAPGALLLALEGRAPWEFAASILGTPWLRKLPAGDGHRVLVLPGLAANDLTTLPMRTFLKDRGYQASPWEQGLNLGPRAGVLDALRARVRSLFELDGKKISLVGWSLGGVYARELAKEMPEMVRCVITLGSPFAGPPQATNAWWLFEKVSGHPEPDAAMQAALRLAPPVPTTSIYSRTDGIVAWQCSLNPPGALAENIEVHASHIGLGLNPLSMMAIADRLAQDPKRWRPFDTSGLRRFFFKTGC